MSYLACKGFKFSSYLVSMNVTGPITQAQLILFTVDIKNNACYQRGFNA